MGDGYLSERQELESDELFAEIFSEALSQGTEKLFDILNFIFF